MIRIALLGAVLASACGCGVGTPATKGTESPKPEPQKEIYDKVAPMPREAKPK
jgi:hypothetical protein